MENQLWLVAPLEEVEEENSKFAKASKLIR